MQHILFFISSALLSIIWLIFAGVASSLYVYLAGAVLILGFAEAQHLRLVKSISDKKLIMINHGRRTKL